MRSAHLGLNYYFLKLAGKNCVSSVLESRVVTCRTQKQANHICRYSSLMKSFLYLRREEILKHCVKSVQVQRFSWYVFSCIKTRKNCIFGHFSRTETLRELSIVGKTFSIFQVSKFYSKWKFLGNGGYLR